MAMADYRMPTDKEIEIMCRNGVEPKGVAVTYRDDRTLQLLRFKTRDQITIRMGDKKW